MIDDLDIGLDEALNLMLPRIRPLEAEAVDVYRAVDRIVSEDLRAHVDSPSVDASLKDGFAVVSRDVSGASPDRPKTLKLIGCVGAGDRPGAAMASGLTVRVLTGARIPDGADAVVSEEFAEAGASEVRFHNFAEPGRNILRRGSDVALGAVIANRGQRLTPGMAGMLAAAGHGRIPVFRNPRVGILATGDEVVAPGQPLPEGKLYASNITTLGAWCRRYGMNARMDLVRDNPVLIRDAVTRLMAETDALITSGGAWTGDRDLIAQILKELGWEQVFHRIRIGPGKAVGFGMLEKRPIFILPGGPPSNLMGFLQIALPGLLTLAGDARNALPRLAVRLAEDLVGRHAHWTQFIYGMLETHAADMPVFHSLKGESRLKSMAEAQAIVAISEGETRLKAGSVVSAQVLS